MEFTASQKQAVIKFIQKKNRDKTFIKNIDCKIVSKAVMFKIDALVKHGRLIFDTL